MPFYAHAAIESGDTKYQRGDAVPEDIDGFAELVEAGSVSEQPYDPASEPTQTPDFVEIDGVRYEKVASDAAQSADGADVGASVQATDGAEADDDRA